MIIPQSRATPPQYPPTKFPAKAHTLRDRRASRASGRPNRPGRCDQARIRPPRSCPEPIPPDGTLSAPSSASRPRDSAARHRAARPRPRSGSRVGQDCTNGQRALCRKPLRRMGFRQRKSRIGKSESERIKRFDTLGFIPAIPHQYGLRIVDVINSDQLLVIGPRRLVVKLRTGPASSLWPESPQTPFRW